MYTASYNVPLGIGDHLNLMPIAASGTCHCRFLIQVEVTYGSMNPAVLKVQNIVGSKFPKSREVRGRAHANYGEQGNKYKATSGEWSDNTYASGPAWIA